MTVEEALQILDDSIHDNPITDYEVFKTVLVLSKWAIVHLQGEHEFYHEIFDHSNHELIS